MNKSEMIEWLKLNVGSWESIYVLYSNLPVGEMAIHGWYVAFDGPSLEEMYLTNEDPLGDISGESITFVDYNGS